MMDRQTAPYRRPTLRGTLGAGMSILLGNGHRGYCMVEHLTASAYHGVGERQTIIVDQAELGRDYNCLVRYDESLETVSRRHAAIVRQGDRWLLVQLSATNTTLLNGLAVGTQWQLQDGDEIQLSVGGPRLRFILSEGEQSQVEGLTMTERLTLFHQQALKPNRRAIGLLGALVLVAVGVMVGWNMLQKKDFDQQIAQARSELASIQEKNSTLAQLLAVARQEQQRQDSLIALYSSRQQQPQVQYVDRSQQTSSLLAAVENDVFFLSATVFITDGQETRPVTGYGWSGTGFLTTDGRFITAKHCVEGWKYALPVDNDEALTLLYFAMNTPGCRIVADITAVSGRRTLHFTSDQFVMNHSDEQQQFVEGDRYIVEAQAGPADWAYARTQEHGTIVVDKDLSTRLPMGADLHLLGYPMGLSSEGQAKPLYGSCKTAQKGLDNGMILIGARNYEHGNSGGPVFYEQGGALRAVGIVSYSVTATSQGGITAISNLR